MPERENRLSELINKLFKLQRLEEEGRDVCVAKENTLWYWQEVIDEKIDYEQGSNSSHEMAGGN